MNFSKIKQVLSVRRDAGLFFVFVLAALLSGLVLTFSGMLSRSELQTIDRMFEVRRWITWNPESLSRLNFTSLINYHEKHEIPRRWWAWDYTLSWLLEPNHVPVKNKFILFNHLLEDEPPLEALESFPWMKPLMRFPFSRADLAKTIEFVANSNVRLIILDNDFPQYSEDDAVLARTISRCSSGELTGRKVPVLMASTINRRSFINILQLDVTSGPSGVLNELQKLEPGVDVLKKYTGTTSMLLDEDQVVRRTVCSAPDANAKERSSITVKALTLLGQPIPADLPREMDIDFAGPPNSELYPVRPFHYLLDPDLQVRLKEKPSPNNHDVTLEDAIVLIGDGVTDVYATPFTNLGVNLMSGPEIIVQSIDTISRHSWHHRLAPATSALYLAFCAISGAALLCVWKNCFHKLRVGGNKAVPGLLLDIACCVLTISLSYLVACVLFSYMLLIVPVIVPAMSLMIASLTSALWEKENEKTISLKQELDHVQERLKLQDEKHEEELRRRLAEAHVQEVVQDEQRRQEFIRRINHDLKAPVTVMSWILSKLKLGGMSPEAVSEKIEKLAKTSNRLVDLLHELASSYETASQEKGGEVSIASCQLNKILNDCVAMARPLAEMKEDQIDITLPDRILWVNGVPLKLSRIFDNLIRNAVIHNPKGTQIHIEARSSAHVHKIFVSDNGKGMAPETVAKLFDKDSKIDLKSSNGDGLGLQIVTAFVESMGGKVSVSSKLGIGTTFSITLPSSHLEAGGDSGEDILSTGQYRAFEISAATAAAIIGVAASREGRGSDHE